MADEAIPVVTGVGNCTGELVLQPPLEGDTCSRYVCAVCGQRVMVGAEHLAEYGLPPEHARLEE